MAFRSIDWAAVDERLPTAPVPWAKAKRDVLFMNMDTTKNGMLTITEVANGLPALLENGRARRRGDRACYLVPLEDFRPAVKCAFAAARKLAPPVGSGKKTREKHSICVDRREFHALLLAFRTYLELLVLFEGADQDENAGRLNWQECRRALPLLENWNIDEEKVRKKFPDDWDATITFAEFADWCIMNRYGKLELELDHIEAEATLKDAAGDGAAMRMLKAFHDWDTDDSGTISAEELTTVLLSLDNSFTKEEAVRLFQAADLNHDGFIDYYEFTKWLTS